jgi:hypothetical protein
MLFPVGRRKRLDREVQLTLLCHSTTVAQLALLFTRHNKSTQVSKSSRTTRTAAKDHLEDASMLGRQDGKGSVRICEKKAPKNASNDLQQDLCGMGPAV